MKKKDNRVIIFGIGIILILVIILICVDATYKKPDLTTMTEKEVDLQIEEDRNEAQKKALSKMNESDRAKHYASCFMDKIDLKQYEEAYDMLYDEFKNNYFPTLASFEEYAEKTFPNLFTLDHTNVERNGNIYVLWTTIYDIMKSRNEGTEINFVIQENDLNDFVLSFSVI